MHNYKDIIYCQTYWTPFGRRFSIQYRFRFDPVPGVHTIKSIGSYYRNPKTIQERRYSFEYPELVRPKRRARMLPDPWDDIPYKRLKRSWKRTKKKKQWMQ